MMMTQKEVSLGQCRELGCSLNYKISVIQATSTSIGVGLTVCLGSAEKGLGVEEE